MCWCACGCVHACVCVNRHPPPQRRPLPPPPLTEPSAWVCGDTQTPRSPSLRAHVVERCADKPRPRHHRRRRRWEPCCWGARRQGQGRADVDRPRPPVPRPLTGRRLGSAPLFPRGLPSSGVLLFRCPRRPTKHAGQPPAPSLIRAPTHGVGGRE